MCVYVCVAISECYAGPRFVGCDFERVFSINFIADECFSGASAIYTLPHLILYIDNKKSLVHFSAKYI